MNRAPLAPLFDHAETMNMKPNISMIASKNPLDIIHACVKMFHTGTWASPADIAPVKAVKSPADVL